MEKTNTCTVCSMKMCNECMINSNHTKCIECGDEFTCMKNKLCKYCDRHPFDMDNSPSTNNITLEQAFDSILTKNFEEYVKPEDKKPVKKIKYRK